MANPNELKQGQFLGTTQIYDLDVKAQDAADFNVRLRQNLNNMVISLNAKVAGYYSQEEYINGKLFYPDYTRVDGYNDAPPTFRQVYSNRCTSRRRSVSTNKKHSAQYIGIPGSRTDNFYWCNGNRLRNRSRQLKIYSIAVFFICACR